MHISRHFVDRVVKHIMLALATLSLLILVLIALYIFREAWPAFKELGLSVFDDKWYPSREAYGIMTMIVGTIVSTTLALFFAVPLSIGCALFLAEVAPPQVAQVARPAVELLVGIPSVVYGMVGVVFLSPIIADISGQGSGSSVLAAGIVLAIMILPTVTSISEDGLRAVPRAYKDASLALGATRWQTIWHVLLPAARSSIVAAVILGLGRAIGETMAMMMVIGNSPQFPHSIFDSARTLTGNIAAEIAHATGLHADVLWACGALLFIMVLGLNTLGILAYRGKIGLPWSRGKSAKGRVS
ncbi:MAG: phosphate ABC transporter permease subunit PstC [Chloroflexota bacterium]|nr:phosphate ABC transporter permease subunit PstC [Chloroflexota bacterium]